jgi:hypothetical protein
MKDFEDTLETKSKASLEEITECAVKHRKIQMSLGPLVADPEPSRNHISKIQQEYLLESDANPAITNARREEALGDPFNAISYVVIAMAIMAATESRPNGRFHPQNVINFDAMATMIGQPQGWKKVVMLRGTRKRMKFLGRSASRASRVGERKQRGVKLIGASSSSGEAKVSS